MVQLERSSAIRLPSLKTLQLDIGYVDVTSVDILLSGCTILETLELSFSPASLTTLRATFLKELKFTVKNSVGTRLEIDAPGLEYLSLTDITLGDAVRNLHNVDEAYLDLFPPPGESVSVDPLLNLLRAIPGVKHLVLCCSTTKRLLFGGHAINYNFPELDFPEFRHLLHLELILGCFNMSFLFHVLQKCPMLQALIIQNDKDPSLHPYGWASSPQQYGWASQPISVPNCLVSQLTFIHFKGYGGFLNEQEFARYVLQNGLVLKTVFFSGLSLVLKDKWEKYHNIKKMSDIPRGSALCQLKFD